MLTNTFTISLYTIIVSYMFWPYQAIIIGNTVTRDEFDTSVCSHNLQLLRT